MQFKEGEDWKQECINLFLIFISAFCQIIVPNHMPVACICKILGQDAIKKKTEVYLYTFICCKIYLISHDNFSFVYSEFSVNGNRI
ncbi:hypothetical protein XENTR_v10014317 [Xenopus tropicalis]|nr:hypothetical protein XENTR_v10014317 [Xenopus tropicalis]